VCLGEGNTVGIRYTGGDPKTKTADEIKKALTDAVDTTKSRAGITVSYVYFEIGTELTTTVKTILSDLNLQPIAAAYNADVNKFCSNPGVYLNVIADLGKMVRSYTSNNATAVGVVLIDTICDDVAKFVKEAVAAYKVPSINLVSGEDCFKNLISTGTGTTTGAKGSGTGSMSIPLASVVALISVVSFFALGF
jgi:hypothetical protein